MQVFKKELLARNGLNRLDHQLDCISWCLRIENVGAVLDDGAVVRSGIIADEMGLGKTLQMLGLIIEQITKKPRTLIVLPRALLEQWHQTIEEFLGHDAAILHGSKKVLDTNAPIVLTTYGTMASQCKRKSSDLSTAVWDRVIFDEAHHMRNPKSLAAKAAAGLNCAHKWLLTGTPIQNSLGDIKSLCQIVGAPQDLLKKEPGLVGVLQKILLRRTKESVGLELPTMTRTVVHVAWSSKREKELAEDIHALVSFSGVIGKMKSADAVPPHHFVVLQQTRQSCIDAALLKGSVTTLQEAGIITASEEEAMDLIGRSKMQRVIEVITQQPKAEKKLVFCHYRKEIDRIVSELRSRNLRVEAFDGRTKQSAREELLANADIDVLVLQIKTGCEGLNLQTFNQVYFVTPHWNPAVEDQAVARCHRQGQEKVVRVFTFRMEPFDEEKATRSLDIHISYIQLKKRLAMCLVDRCSRADSGEMLDEKCAICLSDMHAGDSILLPCGHRFHTNCMENWAKRAATCPTCRQ